MGEHLRQDHVLISPVSCPSQLVLRVASLNVDARAAENKRR